MVVLLLDLLAYAGGDQFPVQEVVLHHLMEEPLPTKLMIVAFLMAVAWQSMQLFPLDSEKNILSDNPLMSIPTSRLKGMQAVKTL